MDNLGDDLAEFGSSDMDSYDFTPPDVAPTTGNYLPGLQSDLSYSSADLPDYPPSLGSGVSTSMDDLDSDHLQLPPISNLNPMTSPLASNQGSIYTGIQTSVTNFDTQIQQSPSVMNAGYNDTNVFDVNAFLNTTKPQQSVDNIQSILPSRSQHTPLGDSETNKSTQNKEIELEQGTPVSHQGSIDQTCLISQSKNLKENPESSSDCTTFQNNKHSGNHVQNPGKDKNEEILMTIPQLMLGSEQLQDRKNNSINMGLSRMEQENRLVPNKYTEPKNTELNMPEEDFDKEELNSANVVDTTLREHFKDQRKEKQAGLENNSKLQKTYDDKLFVESVTIDQEFTSDETKDGATDAKKRGPVKLMLKFKFKREQEDEENALKDGGDSIDQLVEFDNGEGISKVTNDTNSGVELLPGTTVIDTGKEKVILQQTESPENEQVIKPSYKLSGLPGGINLWNQMEIDIHVDDETQCVIENGKKKWNCNICTKNYTTKHNLINHMLGHNGIKPHACVICNKFFKQQSHLNTHLLTHRNIKPYTCQVCNRSFTQASHMKRHMAIHMEKRPHVCEVCGRGFAYPSELRAHADKHKNNEDNTCSDCGKCFDTPRKLKSHTQTEHRDVADLTCKECGKVFTYPSQLRDHIVKHAGTRPFMCGECGMEFMKEHHLKAHQFTHTGLRPYSCKICGRAFNQRANMLRHLLIHENDRKFKCDVCDRTFTQHQTLKAHMVTHAEKKPYQCNVCGKEFGRLHNLQGHMHIHENSKPHVCFCGASFTLKGNLNRHMKVKHGGDGDGCTEEEAAKILNSMSNRRCLEETDDGTDSPGEGRKKRKSEPRKLDEVQNDDIETEWSQLSEEDNGVTEIKNKSKIKDSSDDNSQSSVE